ncbi:hypothetical protein EAI_01088 [Harpegnathos saltator]|uniref:Uncharacterized protein n=1 Tax=Harpegnathos saltator TaxID=610380 RepID=E2B904_HARSA|nr:hypothetical protein EAI_01088 [Harpegnathos saltator]
MTAQCRNAMSKYMDSFTKELSKKMEVFRCYDIAQLDIVIRPKLWRRCTLFVDPLIFGKSKFYWGEWKKQWDARLDEWTTHDDSIGLDPTSQVNEDDSVLVLKADDSNEVETGILQRRASMLARRTDSDVSASRLALLSLSKTSGIDTIRRLRKRDVRTADESRRRARRVRKTPDVAKDFREKHRIKSLVRDVAKPQVDATILRRRLRSSRIVIDSPSTSENIFEENGEDTMALRRIPEIAQIQSNVQAMPKLHKSARERRRERFNINLQ